MASSSSLSKQNAECTVDSVSLGMVVIDEIRLPSRPPLIDVAGGSGAFATLGCRLFASHARSHKVGCLVLAGSDFPEAVRMQLSEWQISLVVTVAHDKLSTRGLLEYEDDTFGPKKFHYTTPPLKASSSDLVGTELLGASAVHILATPEELQVQVLKLIELREQNAIKKRPFIVWEPFPAACAKQNQAAFLEACKYVDVFSPNHFEMCALFEETPVKKFRKGQLEIYATEFSKAMGPDHNGIVVVRAGEHGSFTTQNAAKSVWLPPYYQEGSTKVVDPTGAGNTFLGGFIAGYNVSHDATEASIYGNVAASFALEQIGLPSVQYDDELEIWNCVRVQDRLSEYRLRVQAMQG